MLTKQFAFESPLLYYSYFRLLSRPLFPFPGHMSLTSATSTTSDKV